MGWLIAAAVLLAGVDSHAQGTQRPAPTTLVIYAVDPVAGTAVKLSRAEVYVDVWGSGETYSLQPDGNAVRVPLQPGWQCSIDAGWCGGLFHFGGRITLRADGYEAVASDHFEWLKGPGDRTSIRFPGGRTVPIAGGRTEVVTIPLRRPIARQLRIVDRAGRPVSDAKITIRETLARTNHCGVPEGETLFEGPVGADGGVPLPEGQREFSVSVWKPHFAYVPRTPYVSDWLDGRFDSPDAVITIEKMERRTLQLEVRHSDGTPAVVRLMGSWAAGCMFSGVPIGKTDQRGRLTLEEFYPEEFSNIGVEVPGGATWLFDPRKERWSGFRVITLK